jgi:hypothetical protein
MALQLGGELFSGEAVFLRTVALDDEMSAKSAQHSGPLYQNFAALLSSGSDNSAYLLQKLLGR